MGCLAALSLTIHSASAQNLLTVNPSFETGGSTSYFNGSFSFSGWSGNNKRFQSMKMQSGGTDGSREFRMGYGGYIQTASSARASVIPGRLYRLNFDHRTSENSRKYSGSLASIRFYDSGGALVQNTKFLHDSDSVEIQDDTGVQPYETFTVFATAPDNAAKAGVYFTTPWNEGSTSDFRKVFIDNFRLIEMQEEDKVAIRRAPGLVEPGRTSQLLVRYGVSATREIAVRLYKGSTSQGEVRTTVNKGRGVATINYPVPGGASNGTDYEWRVRCLTNGGSWSSPLSSKTFSNVILDQTVSGSGTIDPDNPHLLYTGRWDRDNPANAHSYWVSSQIFTRFQGTSLKIKGGVPSGDSSNFFVFVDGVRYTVNINGTDQTKTVVTGLSDTVHDLRIFRTSFIGNRLTFKGLVLDSGKGVLKPDPLDRRRIECYGDSITEGAEADHYGTYANLLTRELGAQLMVTAKGGIGLTGSFTAGGPNMFGIWNMINFTGFNSNSSGGAKLWDFSNWQADVVVLAIGHNDQFFQGHAWTNEYADFIALLRGVYPNAHIFCTNMVMSSDHNMWQKACTPVAEADPKVHFQFFRPDQDHSTPGHPTTQDHRGMTFGEGGSVRTVREWNPGLLEWIEETMGWGIGYGTTSGGGGGGSSSSSSGGRSAIEVGWLTPSK